MRQLVKFRNNVKGSVSMIFCAALLPMIGVLGVAVDYAKATQAKAVMQGAIDSTVLMLARLAPNASPDELTARGNRYYVELMRKRPDIATSGITLKKGDKSISATASGKIDTHFGGLFGQPTWDIGVATTSVYGGRKIEVVLVLDNTGSMNDFNKIGELRKASHSLLNILQSVSNQNDQVKVSLVPYTTRVNLGKTYKDETWLTPTPTGTFANSRGVPLYSFPPNRNAWQGCVADRDAGYNNAARPVSISVAQSLYPMVNCVDNLTLVQPLTSDFRALHNSVDAMRASGNTNITLGAQWGYEMLSSDAPFTQTSSANDVERFMVLLTDGMNTQDRWGVGDEARMNKDTQAMCDAITERNVPSSARKLRITLYTVLVIAGNEPLLRNCATSPDFFKKVRQANELEAVFKQIAEDIGQIRLSM